MNRPKALRKILAFREEAGYSKLVFNVPTYMIRKWYGRQASVIKHTVWRDMLATDGVNARLFNSSFRLFSCLFFCVSLLSLLLRCLFFVFSSSRTASLWLICLLFCFHLFGSVLLCVLLCFSILATTEDTPVVRRYLHQCLF